MTELDLLLEELDRVFHWADVVPVLEFKAYRAHWGELTKPEWVETFTLDSRFGTFGHITDEQRHRLAKCIERVVDHLAGDTGVTVYARLIVGPVMCSKGVAFGQVGDRDYAERMVRHLLKYLWFYIIQTSMKPFQELEPAGQDTQGGTHV